MSATTDEITQKVNKILETRLDGDKETLEALNDLSTFLNEDDINPSAFKHEIQQRGLQITDDFLDHFKSVKDSIEEISGKIEEISLSIQGMKDNLSNSKTLTFSLLAETNRLQSEALKLQTHNQIAESFLGKFQLTVQEHQLLYGVNREDPITKEFFRILDRVQQIHSDCRILMQSGYQTAALDIMEEMTLHQEGALERLYRWTQNHCRNIENTEISDLVMLSMNRLQDRPVLFKYVVDEYATSRRAHLVRSFIDALTVGGGGAKPIENHANDPKRYIGDMFAWLHQAIPGEKENLMQLVKGCDKNDITDQIQNALSNISDGVCHPLKVRVETILNSEKDTIILFAIFNMLRFYQNIINQVVKGGELEQTLLEIHAFSEDKYLSSLSGQVKNILQKPTLQTIGLEPPQRDLVPPHSVGKLLSILKEILSVASMVEGRQSDIAKIMSHVIDPLQQTVQESASHLPTIDMAVYLLNCFYHMQSTLAVYEYIDERVERLQGQSEAQIDTLTSEQASSLVANLNLGPIYTILQNPTSDSTTIDINLLKIFMNKLDAFLEMPDILLLPQISLLMSSNHRTTVQKRAFNVIIALYKQIYERIANDEHLTGALTRSPEDLAKILIG